jgi:hypothetical protein
LEYPSTPLFTLEREGTCQRRLPQRLHALEVGINLGFDFTDEGQVVVAFGDDSGLLL